jgi:hypothetical protein
MNTQLILAGEEVQRTYLTVRCRAVTGVLPACPAALPLLFSPLRLRHQTVRLFAQRLMNATSGRKAMTYGQVRSWEFDCCCRPLGTRPAAPTSASLSAEPPPLGARLRAAFPGGVCCLLQGRLRL